MQAIATLVQDDPYLKMTKAERRAVIKARKARFRKRVGLDVPVSCPSASARYVTLPALELKELPAEPVFSFGQWLDRQEQLNPLPRKEPWFSIVGETDPPEPKKPRILDIQRVVRAHFQIGRTEYLSDRRIARLVWGRQVGMYISKVMTGCSLPEIGRRFGDRDHTTVLHAVRKITALVLKDLALAAEIEMLKAQALDIAA